MQVRLNTIVAAAVVMLGASAYAQDMVVKIGHVGPTSGAQAHYGKDNENGARMAVEELNTKGVVIGGKKAKFELVAEDDGADPKQGASVATKLCDTKVAGVVGHLNSGTTMPASKIYNDCGIPHITPSSTLPKITQQGFKTTFRILANDNSLGAGLALYAAESLKLKKIAVIDDRSAYGQGVAEVFTKIAKQKGIEIVATQFTTDKATDFTAILTAIKSKTPDGVFFGGMDPQGGPMLRQMEQLGLANVKYFGGDGICTDKLIELAAGAKTLGNVTCAEGGATLAKMPGGTAWKARYDAKYPKQFQVYSPYTYDATNLLVAAMVKAGSADPKVYMPVLAKIEYQGVTGKIAFEDDGDLKNPSMSLYTYKDGKKIPLN